MNEIISSLEEEKPPGSPLLSGAYLRGIIDSDRVFVKYEGANPTGTQKDRISENHVKRALSLGMKTVSVATCGNYGASISYYSRKYNIDAVIGIPEYYSNVRSKEMVANGSRVIKYPYKYEEIVELFHKISERNGWYDASPGSRNDVYDIIGYSIIAIEIYKQLGHSPDYIAVPVGNGTTLAGIYYGFRALYDYGYASNVPRFIAASTSGGNPIVESYMNGSKKIMELSEEKIRETNINEPLVAYRSYDGQKALDALYDTEGYAFYVNDDEMINASHLMKMNGLSVLPASASAAVAAARVLKNNDECVIVITGRDH
ncbi:pyridoxal-phosphate dependent enzyme [Picrophilus oshimae]|uniref:Pyridoxal-phosphate dependent enzyme n=1 Tax=Picrophilus torridus (strain ATCC 700027 / DSM 9790 / JCM 10055 / NBRC 100828 / KAW 2/3) TaxID=1122961 RepID=Q6L1K3_PICTO|nr:pyridoxal-phosphate dependent enzyme [Picrophilus oshimae]AAT43149.1 pyridoxal-phosphate dependent enzyme [Picrophilus oshimae DSM 9789]